MIPIQKRNKPQATGCDFFAIMVLHGSCRLATVALKCAGMQLGDDTRLPKPLSHSRQTHHGFAQRVDFMHTQRIITIMFIVQMDTCDA